MSYYTTTWAQDIEPGDHVRAGDIIGKVARTTACPALPETEDNDYYPEVVSLAVDTGAGTVIGFDLYPFERVERLSA